MLGIKNIYKKAVLIRIINILINERKKEFL